MLNSLGPGNGPPNLSMIQGGLDAKGGGGGMSDLVTRVAVLETHVGHIQDDVREIKADLKTAIGYLSVLPTKRDLDSWRWQWMATGVGIVALTVGGITGGLALIARFAG